MILSYQAIKRTADVHLTIIWVQMNSTSGQHRREVINMKSEQQRFKDETLWYTML